MLVYVAGPMSKGRWEENTRLAIDAAAILLEHGHQPFLPQVYCLVDLVHPSSYERWMEFDFAFIEVCDALLRLPGVSPGADREVAYATQKCIPVFDDIIALVGHVPG